MRLAWVDRLYLNACVPNLQVGGQVVQFLVGHRGNQVPSPALFEQNGNSFRQAVKDFAAQWEIPILRLNKPDRSRFDDRKLDHVRPYLEAAEREGRHGVVAIVAAQESQWVFAANKRSETEGKAVWFGFVKVDAPGGGVGDAGVRRPPAGTVVLRGPGG
jgi:hypothetical protein